MLIIFLVNNCSGRISNHGVLNIEKHITSIVNDKLEKAEIEALLGPPSTISAFEFNKWYYINNTIKHMAFYKPEIIKLTVSFVSDPDKRFALKKGLYSSELGDFCREIICYLFC